MAGTGALRHGVAWAALAGVLGALAGSAGASPAARAGPCAGHAAREAHIAAVLSSRADARLRRGDPRAARDRKRARWHGRLARYYRSQAERRARPRGTAVTLQNLRRSRALKRRFLTSFEQLTPENEMKMERTQPVPGLFRFAEADRVVRFARRWCKRIRGHTLVYGRQLPHWVSDDSLSPVELGFEMEWHVRTMVGRYAGRIAEWDVVNEAIGPDGSYVQNAWYRKLGEEYVARAFRAAAAADPRARLFYNDNGIELPDHPHTVAVRRMVADLRRTGVPIHGVGIQNHVSTTHSASEAELARTIKGFTDLGVDVAVTEMDVRLDSPGSRSERLERQRLVYRSAARACAAARRCTSFSTWGIADGVSWLGPAAAGLLFDRSYRPKPSYAAVARSLGSLPGAELPRP
jgi:endo-1,4-beta-xylanase